MIADQPDTWTKYWRFAIWDVNGAAYVTRTRDPVITNDVLYQLS